MNTTSLITIAALCLVLVACSSKRPEPNMQAPNPEKRLYVLKHRLGLSDAQVVAIRPIITQESEQKGSIMESADPGDREEMKEVKTQLEDLEWKTIKELSKHLTEEQLKLYSDLLLEEEAAMKEEMESRGGPGGGRGGPRGGRR